MYPNSVHTLNVIAACCGTERRKATSAWKQWKQCKQADCAERGAQLANYDQSPPAILVLRLEPLAQRLSHLFYTWNDSLHK